MMMNVLTVLIYVLVFLSVGLLLGEGVALSLYLILLTYFTLAWALDSYRKSSRKKQETK